MNSTNSFLAQEYWGNTVRDYAIALGIIIGSIILLLIVKGIVMSRLKRWAERTENTIDDLIINGINKNVLPLLYVGCFYLGIQSLNIEPRYGKFIENTWVVIFTFFAIRVITAFVEYMLTSFVSRRYASDEKSREIKGMLIIVKVILWVMGLVFLLDNLGFDVTTVITGLGIGGIAVALAAQTILGDLFAYFVIFFDRPFEIGDFVIVGDKMGTIETIGIKTTRIRSLGGEELIMSNKDLTDSRLHNYKRMLRRRIVFKIGVTYDTKADTLEAIPEIMKEAILSAGDTEFDRAHFASYGDFSLDFEAVYFVSVPDYNIYMDKQQAINMYLFRAFEERGIEFAFPTQTLYVNKVGKSEKDGEEAK